MIRCIYCGMCEEVCPEQAIFLRKDYAIVGTLARRWSITSGSSTSWAVFSMGLFTNGTRLK
jgi:ferredoxin